MTRRIHFLNVKQGDCCIIQHGSGRVTMIDVNNARASSDETIESLNEQIRALSAKAASFEKSASRNYRQADNPENPFVYMAKRGVNSIFRFILTHPDMDHMDGIKDIFNQFSPPNIWDTDNTCEKEDDWTGSPYREEDWRFYKKLRNNEVDGVKRLTYLSGTAPCDFWRDDGLNILAPTAELVSDANDCEDWNDCSYVIIHRIKNGITTVFGGDSHDKTWEHILQKHKTVKNIDLLVAPHHGRKSDRDYSFLDTLKPKLTLFGNAPSEHLAYDAWSTRGLDYITNNQAGSVIVDADSTPAKVYVTNKEFAKDRTNKSPVHNAALDAYYLQDL